MSENTSKFVQKLNNMKPSSMDDERKSAVKKRIKIIGALTAGVLATATIVSTAKYYNSFSKSNETETAE